MTPYQAAMKRYHEMIKARGGCRVGFDHMSHGKCSGDAAPAAPVDPEERIRDVGYMQLTDDWPRWPVLPMKRYSSTESGGHMPTPGFLVAGKGPIIYRGCIFQINPGQLWDDFSREMYPSYEAMFDAGWRVD